MGVNSGGLPALRLGWLWRVKIHALRVGYTLRVAMVRPYLLRSSMISMWHSLLSLSQGLLAGDPADFAQLESMQSQKSQLLLRTLTLSHD
ncbi:hypothetical protein OKW40_005137 [Paraburkholderia sp. RAU6.4a]